MLAAEPFGRPPPAPVGTGVPRLGPQGRAPAGEPRSAAPPSLRVGRGSPTVAESARGRRPALRAERPRRTMWTRPSPGPCPRGPDGRTVPAGRGAGWGGAFWSSQRVRRGREGGGALPAQPTRMRSGRAGGGASALLRGGRRGGAGWPWRRGGCALSGVPGSTEPAAPRLLPAARSAAAQPGSGSRRGHGQLWPARRPCAPPPPAGAAWRRAAGGHGTHLRAARQRRAVLPRGGGVGREVLPGLPGEPGGGARSAGPPGRAGGDGRVPSLSAPGGPTGPRVHGRAYVPRGVGSVQGRWAHGSPALARWVQPVRTAAAPSAGGGLCAGRCCASCHVARESPAPAPLPPRTGLAGSRPPRRGSAPKASEQA